MEHLSLDPYQIPGSLAQVPRDRKVRAAGDELRGTHSPLEGDLNECHPGLVMFGPSLGIVWIQLWQDSEKCVKVLFDLFLASVHPQITCSRKVTEVMESTLRQSVESLVWGGVSVKLA